MRVSLRWWEVALLVIPALLALLFLVGGHPAAGVVLLSVILLIVATRAQIAERNLPGGYARTRAYLGAASLAGLVAIYLVIIVLLFVAQRDDWNDTTPGVVAVYAMAGLAFFLLRELNRLGNEVLDWLHGGGMEARIGKALEGLRDEGWVSTLTHDLKKDKGGNVDHVIVGPRGALVIETKTGKNNAAARRQTVGNAMWVREKFGERYVTGVLCVGTEPPPQPVRFQHVWVLGPGDLVGFVRKAAGPLS